MEGAILNILGSIYKYVLFHKKLTPLSCWLNIYFNWSFFKT